MSMKYGFIPTPWDEPSSDHEALCEKARNGSRALSFLQTVATNLDNGKLIDEEFRDFMRRSMTGMPGITYPPEK
jgi:hypothetical protein